MTTQPPEHEPNSFPGELGKFMQIGTREKELLRENLKALLSKQDELVPGFYARFFAQYPEVERLFINKHSEKMEAKIMQSLIHLVKHLDRPDILVPTLLELGRKHEHYGALAVHYPIAIDILLDTMGVVCGKSWNNEIRSVWNAALQAASRVMLNGYHQGEAHDAGSQNRKENHGEEAA